MARPRKDESEKLKLLQMKVHPSTEGRVEELAKKFQSTKAEISRLAHDAGLTALEGMNERSLVDYVAKDIKFTVGANEEEKEENPNLDSPKGDLSMLHKKMERQAGHLLEPQNYASQTLLEVLENHPVSLAAICEELAIDTATLDELKTGERLFDEEHDLKLTKYLGFTRGYFIRLQSCYGKEKARYQLATKAQAPSTPPEAKE